MFSIILKQVVPACVVRTEELVFRPRVILQRAVCTSNVLAARLVQSRVEEVDLTDGFNLTNDPKDLGRVVDFDVEELENEDETNQTGRKQKRREKKTKADMRKNTDLDVERNEGSDDQVPKKKFEDLRRKNTSSFSSLMTRLKSKRGRETSQCIYLEGKRLIHDAIKAGHTPLKVFFSRLSDLEKLNLPEGVEAFRIPYDKLQFWSDVITSQGLIGVFKMPDLSASEKKDVNSIPLTIVCDNVREPSNLGSILRVVASVGCKKLILTKGCVDIWEPKVLRSAAGAHFHLSMLNNVTWEELPEEIPQDHKVVLACCDLKEDESENSSANLTETQSSFFATNNSLSERLPLKCYSSVDYRKQSTAIIIGGETHGLSREALQFGIDRNGLRVYIPMNNQIESLNNSVALGILSYMIRYQYESSANPSQVGQENDKNNSEVD